MYDAFPLTPDSTNSSKTVHKFTKNNHEFVCCLLLWHSVLFEINFISKLLQKQRFDISEAKILGDHVKTYFKYIMREKEFEIILAGGREVADTPEIDQSFGREAT